MAKLLQDSREKIIEIEGEDVTDIDNVSEDEFNEITTEFGGSDKDIDILIKVYKVLEREGKKAWCFDCLPADLPISDRIRQDFGGGQYLMRIYKNRKLTMGRKLIIAEPSKKSEEKKESDLAMIGKMLAEQQKQNFEQLQAIILQSQGRSVAPVDQMSTMKDTIAILASMREVFGSPSHSPQVNPMDYILKGMEIMKEVGGNNSTESSFVDIFRDLIKSPLLPAVIQANVQPRNNLHKSETPKLPEHTEQSENKNESNIEVIVKDSKELTNEEKNAMNMLNLQINMLANAARNHSDPSLYADLILDNLDDETINNFILNENAFEKLISIRPDLLDCREWFNQLQLAIKSSMSSDNVDMP